MSITGINTYASEGRSGDCSLYQRCLLRFDLRDRKMIRSGDVIVCFIGQIQRLFDDESLVIARKDRPQKPVKTSDFRTQAATVNIRGDGNHFVSGLQPLV